MNVPQPPQPQGQIPNHSNYQPDQELLKIRRRVSDLVRLGAATPETYLQTVMQLFQESERRRQVCMSEAEDCLRRHQALVAQAHGFSAVGSILFAIVNGFATLEERRVIESAERAREQKEKEDEAARLKGNGQAPATNGHPTQEAAGAPEAAAPVAAPPAPVVTPSEPSATKPSGGKRRKKP